MLYVYAGTRPSNTRRLWKGHNMRDAIRTAAREQAFNAYVVIKSYDGTVVAEYLKVV